MTHLLTILFLLLACVAQGAGLGPFNPAQHSVNGFMPTQVKGIFVWMDTSRIGGLTNGQNCQTFTDFSGNGRNFTNDTGSKSPTLQVAFFNGRNALQFDGVDDYLIWKGSQYLDKITVFVVFNTSTPPGTANRTRVYAFARSGENDYQSWIPIYSEKTNSYATWVNNPRSEIQSSQSLNVVFTHLYDGSSLQNFQNKLEGAAYSAGAINGTFTRTVVGAAPYSSSIDAWWNGQIAEVVVYTNALSLTYRTQIQRYLGTKYGIIVK
jgi:hypothetical protein